MSPDVGASGSLSPDPQELMRRYQGGDPAAAQSLIDLLSARLYRFLSADAATRADVDDMFQDAWLRIHRVRHTYRPGAPVLPWVYAIARRVRVDHYRRRQRIARREIATDVLPESAVSESPLASLAPFTRLIAPLPQSQREVLKMLKVDGLSIEEVAEVTSSTVGSVKQRVHRAYERLREILQRTMTGPSTTGEAP